MFTPQCPGTGARALDNLPLLGQSLVNEPGEGLGEVRVFDAHVAKHCRIHSDRLDIGDCRDVRCAFMNQGGQFTDQIGRRQEAEVMA